MTNSMPNDPNVYACGLLLLLLFFVLLVVFIPIVKETVNGFRKSKNVLNSYDYGNVLSFKMGIKFSSKNFWKKVKFVEKR